MFFEALGGPSLRRLPARSRPSDDEGRVPCHKPHELESARLFVELLDDGAIKLIVSDDELCDGIVSVAIVVDLIHREELLSGVQ